jgi:glycyl-tRNA synthetase
MAEIALMEKIVSLAKRRGFVFPGSEIYGGLAGIYDYGPLGTDLRFNIKQYFWQKFVLEREDVYGMSAAILMPERVWEASGHTESFSDPMVECSICKARVRADQPEAIVAHEATHKKERVAWSEPAAFNLLVKTRLGAASQESAQALAYLRGEITQGVHVNFKNIVDSMHPKLPFGIAQVGKAFRNEIAPRDFLFRQREFEQMELQYYIKPDEAEGKRQFEYWKEFALTWYEGLGIRKEHLRLRQHAEDERAHYAKDAWDIEYESPMGWKEAWGIHHRGDWDLRRHSEYSGESLSVVEDDGTRVTPWDIECSGGVDRAVLFVLLDAYREDEVGGEKRVYLALHPRIAPMKAMVAPLLKNKPELVAKAREVYAELKKEIPSIAWDDNGNIGKRYRRQDEIGTPFCITIDFDTLGETPKLKDTITLRHRDSGEQERLGISEAIVRIEEAVA